jgi:hypothetical protein
VAVVAVVAFQTLTLHRQGAQVAKGLDFTKQVERQ